MSEEKIIGYDPMTGEPIKESAAKVEEKIIGYDPMTGEPIKESAAKAEKEVIEEKIVGFDPMTGEPIKEGAAVEPPISDKVTSKVSLQNNAKIKIGVAVLAISVVLAGVLLAFVSGAFGSAHTKLLMATANTLSEENKLSKACKALNLLATDSYTLSLKAEAEGEEIEGLLAVKKNEMQLKGKVDANKIPEVDATLTLNTRQLLGKVNLLEEQLFIYNYTEENDGYLIDYLGDEYVEMINTTLKSLRSSERSDDVAKKLTDALMTEYKEWEIEKVDKKSFEVNGKDRKCAGYTLTLTEDVLQDLVDAAFDALEDEVDEEILDLAYDECDNMFKGMEDVETTIYIYKDMLAAVIFDVDGSELEIFFLGGDYRTQNMLVEADGKTVMEVEGKIDGSIESYEVEAAGETIFALEFDEKSGDIEIETINEYGKEISVEANLKGSANELAFVMDLDDLGVDGSVEIYLEKGANIEKLSGEEFDIGIADEGDWKDLAEDLYDAIY